MKITKQHLIDWGACQEGLERFINQTNDSDKPVEIISLIDGEIKTSDLVWLAGNVCTKKALVQFALNCAKLVLHLTESEDAKEALKAADNWIKNPTEENRIIASDASDAVRATYYIDNTENIANSTILARAAVRAAVRAAIHAVNDVVPYANVTATLTYDAAVFNAFNSTILASDVIQDKINNHLIDLFKLGIK